VLYCEWYSARLTGWGVKPPKRVAQKFHFAILRIEVTRASRGLSAIAEQLVIVGIKQETDKELLIILV